MTETTTLAFDHVGQRLEGTFIGTRHGFATATVVEQAVYRFLQHALFIAGNDFRRIQFKQTAQTAVAVDNATVQVVQVRGSETATIQRHQGTQIGRQHGQHRQHHPLRFDARFFEGFKHFQTLGVFLDLDLRTCQVVTEFFNLHIDFHGLEQITNTFCTHLGLELVAQLDALGFIVVLGHDGVLLECGHARIGNDIRFKVQHPLDVTQGHVQHQT